MSVLRTILPSAPFIHQQQGLYNELSGAPIADGSKLLPFTSMPLEPIAGSKSDAWIMCLDGGHVFKIGQLPLIEKTALSLITMMGMIQVQHCQLVIIMSWSP